MKDIRVPIQVAVFNSLKRYVGCFKSMSAAANVLGVSVVTIRDACNGTDMTCKKHYLRPYNAELLQTDRPPTLLEYDKCLGLNMRYYKTANITRVGLKYKKHTPSEQKPRKSTNKAI